MGDIFLIPAIDSRLQNINSGPININSNYHYQIYQCITVEYPNLFTTENISKVFEYKSLFWFDFNFYNDILIYLTKYLKHLNTDIQIPYMEYVCRHVLGSVSQHTGDKTPTVPIIQAYEKVHGEVLQKLKIKRYPKKN